MTVPVHVAIRSAVSIVVTAVIRASKAKKVKTKRNAGGPKVGGKRAAILWVAGGSYRRTWLHIPTHLMLSWAVGHRLQARRDRRLVAWAGVASDLDGLSILAGVDAYGRWHHVLTHGLLAGLIIAIVFTYWAKDRVKVWWLALGVFHLHLLCDFLGSGIDWPIQYFWPIKNTFYHTPYGWELDSWQNWIAAVTVLLVCGRLAIRSGHSVAETLCSSAIDEAVVATLRRRFSPPASSYVVRPNADMP
jgi:hypothetical protein